MNIGKIAFKRGLLGTCMALALMAPVSAQEASSSVSGIITDPSGSSFMTGAILEIEELGITATTDSRGRYRFPNIPVGTYTLVVSYSGVEPVTYKITVTDGSVDLGSMSVGGASEELEEVVVFGQAALMARAISQQRAADNIKNVIDSDSMGQFPDQNVAESLRRLSGISVETDQGEGRYVVIRGMNPNLNNTTVNGLQSASSESGRAMQLDVIPSDVLDGIEVSKSLTPDMDGDAIGGSVNVKTLSAFRRKGSFLKVRGEGSVNNLSGDFSQKASIAGSDIFELEDGRRLGIAGAFSWHNRNFQVDNNEMDDWETASNGLYYPETFEARQYTLNRKRIGGVLNLDYDMSPNTSLYFKSLYSRFQDTELRLRYEVSKLDLKDDESLSATNVDYGESRIDRETKDRIQTAETLSLSAGGDTRHNNWFFEYSAGYSYARERDPDYVGSVWRSKFEDAEGDLSIDFTDPQQPVISSPNMAAIQDSSRYELDEISFKNNLNTDKQWSFRLDVTRDTEFGDEIYGYIKFGTKVRLRTKYRDDNETIYEGDGSQFLNAFTNSTAGADYTLANDITPMPDKVKVRDLLASKAGLELQEIDTAIAGAINDYTVGEDIYAGYLMAKIETGDLVITGGGRLEHTKFSALGNRVVFAEEGEIIDGAALDSDMVFVTPVMSDKSYTSFLPSVNLKYGFSDKFVGRAAIYKSVVRPGYQDVAFRAAVEDGDAEVGNPLLQPYKSWSFDLSLEYYPTNLSLISVGAFHKKISNFIFVAELEDYNFFGETYDSVTLALNGESAKVTGLEASWQQKLDFLKGAFDGFLLAANYTYVDSEATLPDGRKINLPKQSNKLASFMLGYEKYGFDIRLAMKYKSGYIDEINDEETDRYTDARTVWDLTAKYHVNDNFTVYGELSNLNAAPEYYYAGSRSRAYQYDNIGMTINFGVQAVF